MALSTNALRLLEKFAQDAPPAPPPPVIPPTVKDGVTPYPHQIGALERLRANNGKLVMAHEMGTGKTFTAIYGIESMRADGKANKTLVVVPAGLKENFARDGLEKYIKQPSFQIISGSSDRSRANYIPLEKADPEKQYTIISYEMFARDPVAAMKQTGADTLLFDEFHKARNESSGVYKAALQARPLATNFIGLTASLVNNDASEIASLLTISENRRDISPAQFKRHFTKVIGQERGFNGGVKPVRGLKNKEQLGQFVTPKVDYVTTSSIPSNSMPKKDVKFVDVPMSEDQYKLYQLAMNKLGPMSSYVTRRDPGVIVKDIDPAIVFAQTAHARQIANSVHMGRKMSLQDSAKSTPKVRKMLDDTVQHIADNPDAQVVLYSNLVRGGIDVLSAGLHDRGIDHALFIGKGTELGDSKVTSTSRDVGVEDFKNGRKRVIILSGAGAEGLNLANSTAFYSLDGHFNPERIMQAEARARRLNGQSHRAPENRVVDVRRYVSTAPGNNSGFFGFAPKKKPPTTDQWMYGVAEGKFKQNKDFYNTIENYKYISKSQGLDGKTKYVYPKKQGFLNRVFGTTQEPGQVKIETGAVPVPTATQLPDVTKQH